MAQQLKAHEGLLPPKGFFMRKFFASLLAAGLFASPAQAGDWRNQTIGIEPGVFVGAKLRLSLGGESAGKPRAQLALAPSQGRISGQGMINSSIGEGLALDFTSGSRPTVTLAGVRADQALGLKSGPAATDGTRLGLSDGAKVALGIGAALLIGAGVFYALATDCADHEDECP
jgi:hypothetical protein